MGKQEAWKGGGFLLTIFRALCLQHPIKQGFNKEAGTVFALRLSIIYFYIYLNA